MALYRPRKAVGLNSQKEVHPQGKPLLRPARYDVLSGSAPMHTTPAFKGATAATPQLGLHLGFNK